MKKNEELLKPISEVGVKQYFINQTKLYFKPLSNKWIWIAGIPLTMFFAYLDLVVLK